MHVIDDVKMTIAGSRIPVEYRTDVNAAKTFIAVFKELKYNILDFPNICALAKWAGISTAQGNEEPHVILVENLEDTQTFDLSVPDGHSYVANGIVCHNTTNIPENTPVDVTAKIYMLGWETGCKGVTVYRAGSRDGVLVEKGTEKDESVFAQHSAPERPRELPCKIHHVNIKGETWTLLVGLLENKPYEIFGGLSRFVEIPKKYDEGVVVKNEKKSSNSTYDLKIGNGSGFVIKNIVEQFDNPNHSAMTRMISLSLRHGANIQYVVEQLQKDKDSDMFSFAKVIARVLKTYIPDGSETTAVKVCDSCGGASFAYTEGCISCTSCGWSKCQ